MDPYRSICAIYGHADGHADICPYMDMLLMMDMLMDMLMMCADGHADDVRHMPIYGHADGHADDG